MTKQVSLKMGIEVTESHAIRFMMEKNLLFILLLLLFCRSFGQNSIYTPAKDLDMKELVPPDYNDYRKSRGGCGGFWLPSACSRMDTIRELLRKPFDKHMEGRFYLGTVKAIDSVSKVSVDPLINDIIDSFSLVYLALQVEDVFFSPYNAALLHLVPSDVRIDATENFDYFKRLKQKLSDTSGFTRKFCVLMTKDELFFLTGEYNLAHGSKILLRCGECDTDDILVNGYIYSNQPFLINYNVADLLSSRQVVDYTIMLYRKIYYDLYGGELPDNVRFY